MNEVQWMTTVMEIIRSQYGLVEEPIEIYQGKKLPYAFEIVDYLDTQPNEYNLVAYETDLLIVEKTGPDTWKPRVVIEGKLGSVTTHDAITYSEKAFTHKKVHPFLRYGILLGDRKHYPLPGRLFRHGAYFDFMLSWVSLSPDETEKNNLFEILEAEMEASRNLEEILLISRRPTRKHYSVLHRPLLLR